MTALHPVPEFLSQYATLAGSDPIETICDLLGGAGLHYRGPDRNGEYSAQCPAHDDKVESLRFRVSLDGRLLVFCQANCEFKEIQNSLGLKPWQMRPSRIEYDYYDPGGTYSFTVVRQNQADGSKRFFQGVRNDSGTVDPGRPAEYVPRLWLAPDLKIWADQQDPGSTLWISEGEKDATMLWSVIPSNGFSTTAPGGAAQWNDLLTEQVVRLRPRRIVVVADADPAGLKRAADLIDAFNTALPDCAVEAISPPARVDLAQILDQHGTAWLDKMQPVKPGEYEIEIVPDGVLQIFPHPVWTSGPGCLGMEEKSKIVNVFDAVIEPTAVWRDPRVASGISGWNLVIKPSDPSMPVLVSKLPVKALSSNSEFRAWLGANGISRIANVGAERASSLLHEYIKRQAHRNKVPDLTRFSHLGVVNPFTGEPGLGSAPDYAFLWTRSSAARFDTGDVLCGNTDAAALVELNEGSIPVRWGTQGTDHDARWAFARILTFADPEATSVVAGWVAASILDPWMEVLGYPVRPGMALIAGAGAGKTQGAAAMLMRIAGAPKITEFTPASLRRALQVGRGVILQADDTAVIEHDQAKQTLRLSTTRSSHSKGNQTSSTSVDVEHYLASVAVSAEGVSWTTDPAMMDRFIEVTLSNPQGRMSLLKGRGKISQYQDIVALRDQITDLNDVAGWVVKGILESVSDLGSGSVVEGLKILSKQAQADNPETISRRQYARQSVLVGLYVIRHWLQSSVDRDPTWAGAKEPEVYRNWDWLVESGSRALLDLQQPDEAASSHLVDHVIPRILTEYASLGRIDGHGSLHANTLVISGIQARRYDDWRDESYSAVKSPGGMRGEPALILDTDGRIWTNVRLLISTYEKVVGRQGDQARVVSESGLGNDLTRNADNPAWVPPKGARFGGRNDPRSSYRRLSEMASARALRLSGWEATE